MSEMAPSFLMASWDLGPGRAVFMLIAVGAAELDQRRKMTV
jgi:hypothetical protein